MSNSVQRKARIQEAFHIRWLLKFCLGLDTARVPRGILHLGRVGSSPWGAGGSGGLRTGSHRPAERVRIRELRVVLRNLRAEPGTASERDGRSGKEPRLATSAESILGVPKIAQGSPQALPAVKSTRRRPQGQVVPSHHGQGSARSGRTVRSRKALRCMAHTSSRWAWYLAGAQPRPLPPNGLRLPATP